MIIGKAKKPRCFRNINPKTLPVAYYANKKAWMTSVVFEDWLRTFDRKLGRQRRKALLFLDNASCHPNINLRNVKLKFFPPNTTSKLQPMDQGIIQALKLKYRKKELRRVIARMDEDRAAFGPDLMKATNVLEAIYCVNRSWQEVEDSTIVKCFKKAGFHEDGEIEEEPQEIQQEAEEDLEIVAQDLFGCTLQDLIDIDNDIATCATSNDWDRPVGDLLGELHGEVDSEEDNTSDKENCEEEVTTKSKSLINSLSDAASTLEELKEFALSNGYEDVLGQLLCLKDIVNTKKCERNGAAKQRTLTDFFSTSTK